MKIHEMITEETWCKGHTARLRDGSLSGDSSDLNAVAWCAVGWLSRTFNYGQQRKLAGAIGIAQDEFMVTGRLAAWNDAPSRTFAEVKEAFLKADL